MCAKRAAAMRPGNGKNERRLRCDAATINHGPIHGANKKTSLPSRRSFDALAPT